MGVRWNRAPRRLMLKLGGEAAIVLHRLADPPWPMRLPNSR